MQCGHRIAPHTLQAKRPLHSDRSEHAGKNRSAAARPRAPCARLYTQIIHQYTKYRPLVNLTGLRVTVSVRRLPAPHMPGSTQFDL